MAKSKRYVNFTVSFTPAGGSSTNLTEVEGVRVSRGAKQLMAFGDAKLFPTLIVNTEEARSITISGGDIGDMVTLDRTKTYTVVVTLLDAKNGTTAGGGAFTATLVNAVIETDDHNSQNNVFGQGSITWHAYSSDGSTDPLTITAL